MKYEVVIIGAGPGGLRCAQILAKAGCRVLILEKNKVIGRKVCAGGITWSGLINRVPETLIEQSFKNQLVTTRLQSIVLSSDNPIIATINRQKLGQFLATKAEKNGAELVTGAYVTEIRAKNVVFKTNNKRFEAHFDYLVGADGSQSRVRKSLGLSNSAGVGIGINYIVPRTLDKMEWHFDAGRFGSGYTWIFPHRDNVSVGAYIGAKTFKVSTLNAKLKEWLKERDISVQNCKPQAEKICYNFKGWRFGRKFLVGDAAGLASPLTGEGIYPAFLSSETTAHTIIDQSYISADLEELLQKHHKHRVMLNFAAKNKTTAFVLSEISAFLLRHRLISFDKFEMG